jgi:hypothetical protein
MLPPPPAPPTHTAATGSKRKSCVRSHAQSPTMHGFRPQQLPPRAVTVLQGQGQTGRGSPHRPQSKSAHAAERGKQGAILIQAHACQNSSHGLHGLLPEHLSIVQDSWASHAAMPVQRRACLMPIWVRQDDDLWASTTAQAQRKLMQWHKHLPLDKPISQPALLPSVHRHATATA